MKQSRLQAIKKHPLSFVLRMLVYASAVITSAVICLLIIYILWKGVGNLTQPGLFAWEYTTENLSMMPAIINTINITLQTLIIAVPVGVGAAIYLVEYASRGNKLVKIIRLTTETLSGIPSIVYGLFGYLVFVLTLGWSYTLIAGVITLAIMVLPLIIRTTEEALVAVPDAYREGSFGLGAGKLRTVVRIILPTAMPGILSGVILAIGRIVGESAALIFTAGTNPVIATGWFSSASTLSVHMYALMTEGLHTEQAYAVAVVLLVVVILMNYLSNLLAKKLSGK